MNLELSVREWPRLLGLTFLLAISPAVFAGGAPAPSAAAPAGDHDVIVSTIPMKVDVDNGTGAHGQLVVAPAILSAELGDDLVYTITAEPQHGQVGLAGADDDTDIFQTKMSHFGYFAYRPNDVYQGEDSFGYTVRNETTGLSFKNTVVLTVQPPPPVMMATFEVEANRVRPMNAHGVALTTRPNTPVTQKLPNHEDFMTEADRASLVSPKISYGLDEKTKPQHGTAKLDRTTGELTYAPNPGFIGQDRFNYYTLDENNPQSGMANAVTVSVEPIRRFKQMSVDRSRSREVDLVFVINNSPSMAAHQARIAANLARFRQLFDQHDLDYRIGVLTTDFVDTDPDLPPSRQHYYKEVRSLELDAAGQPVLDRRGRPKTIYKRVASNGNLVTLPALPQPWVTPKTPNTLFAELVKVGTNGDSNRTAFTAVYNFVANNYNKQQTLLRPDATTIVVFFMDEEETRMAVWKDQKDGSRKAEWIENGKLPDLLKEYNERNPQKRQTLDGYINYWVLRPFIIAKGNQRGKLEIDAVVAPGNLSHRRAAELTGGTVLNIEDDFSAPLAALGDRIADTVAVALDPVDPGATLYQKSIRVRVDGKEMPADPKNGWIYDERTNSIRFQGAGKKTAFLAKIDVTYEEHML